MDRQTWRGCVFPDDLLYDVERNVWVRLEGDQVEVGMTDVAQTSCGKLVQISWKPVGRTIARGRSLAVIESAKWVGPFPAPLTGKIVATNAAGFEADILLANRDPYGAGWLVRLQPTDLDRERSDLVDGAAAFEHYRRFIEDNDMHCYRCAE